MSSELKKNVPKIIMAVMVLALLLIGVFITQGPDPIPLTPEERLWLKKNQGQIRLAPCPGWEPMEFFDDSGYRGMVADYIRLIEQKLGFRFKIAKYDSWSHILSEAKQGNVDVIAAAHPTPERWAFMNWTDHYLEFPAVVITQKTDKRTLVPEEMAGMKVGVCRDYIVESYLATTYPDIQLFAFDLGTQGLEKVSFGELDAMVMELPNAFYNIEQNKITNLRIAGKTQWVAKYGIGTRKGLPELHAILQKALTMITPAERRDIHRRWIGLEQTLLLYKKSVKYGVMVICAAVLAIIGTVLAWNLTLKNRIDAATRELQEELKERERVEARTRKLEEQLRQSHKMEAIGTLAGGIAHDFNNILGTIIGYTEMMEMFDAAEAPKMKTRLGHVLSASYRAKELVNQILTFSRRSGQEKRPVTLAPVIRETAKFVQVLLPSGIQVVVQMKEEDRDITVVSNPVEVHQLVMNLSTNALHAIEAENSQGQITITLSRVRMDPHEAARYLGLGPGNYARLAVSDTGKGMSREIMDRMFDPFFTTKPTGKGTGMGLSVVHGIVKDASGHISAQSREGHGTDFIILLPEVDTEEAAHPAPVPNPGKVAGSGRILMVDDETDLLSINREMLEKLGYAVKTDTSPQTALEWFRVNSKDIDLIITDLIMPDLHGDQLAWRAKLIRPDIPVILCSGRIDDDRAQKILTRFGIDGFLHKPAGIGELAQSVRAYLAQSPPGTPSKEKTHG